MGIQAAEISAILKDQIKDFGQETEVAEVGRVLSVGDGIARVYGLDNVQAGEMVEFPGNIRELENMIKRIVVLESEDSILDDLERQKVGEMAGRSALQTLLEEIEETAGDVPLREVGRRMAQQVERETIERILLRTSWNRKQAAKLLQVSYKTLLQKIRECGLEAD